MNQKVLQVDVMSIIFYTLDETPKPQNPVRRILIYRRSGMYTFLYFEGWSIDYREKPQGLASWRSSAFNVCVKQIWSGKAGGSPAARY